MAELKTHRAGLPKSNPDLLIPSDGNERSLCDNDSAWGEIHLKLSQWMQDPASAVDHAAAPPSIRVIQLARLLIPIIQHQGLNAPDGAVADGNGGIAFEWVEGEAFRLIEINKFEKTLMSRFENGKLVSRQAMIV